MRYLAEARLLHHVRAVSAVSGGSVAAAVLADRWPSLRAAGFSTSTYVRDVEEPFHEAISTRNIRNAAIGRWAVRRATLRGRSRGSAMGDVLVKHLVRARNVVDLSPDLQVVLTSTDLSTGRAFRVSRDFIGSWDFGYQPVPETLGLGQAVAASAAVPVLFPPVYLWTADLDLSDAPPVLSLVDGGVYDNLGLEWFQGWRSGRPDTARNVKFIIVVDGSGPMIRNDNELRGISAINRGREIQYFQTRATRIRWLVRDMLDGRMNGLYLVSKHDPASFRFPDGSAIPPEYASGALPQGFGLALARLRTDLDRFLPEEARLLSYHGYWSAHVRLLTVAPDLAVAGAPSWRDYADLGETEASRLRGLLDAGRKRRVRRTRSTAA